MGQPCARYLQGLAQAVGQVEASNMDAQSKRWAKVAQLEPAGVRHSAHLHEGREQRPEVPRRAEQPRVARDLATGH